MCFGVVSDSTSSPAALLSGASHERPALTHQCARRARPAVGSLALSGTAGYALLRGLAVLEVGVVEGHLVGEHPGFVPDRVPRPAASAGAGCPHGRLRGALLPGPPLCGTIQPRGRPRWFLRECDGR